ncbi:hypothetical protein Patl1_31409 [Pistacia atlantica]|uniref:Uncharacterized protein n=1 Tax=Pistacia atlantica TaxID=434234 RepID=A0ACC1ANT0_9ROSI|nr:hypothetical protein Patl1_31409 [Pistacia atlantica]
MMQPELVQPTWPFYNIIGSPFDHQVEDCDLNIDDYLNIGGCEFSSSFTSTDEYSEFSSIPNVSPVFSSEFIQFPAVCDDEVQVMFPMEDFPLELEGFECILSDEVEGLCGSFDESEGSFPSQMTCEREDVWSPSTSLKSSEASVDTTLTLPAEEMEIDTQVSVSHLLKAYGEALEIGQRKLGEVIIKCLSEKVSPAGEALERLAFNLSPDLEKQGEYLMQESRKNFEEAFRAFYQLFPYGRFAHFAANAAILEAMPDDAEIIHVVDFDIGEGVQWPPLIEFCRDKKATVWTMQDVFGLNLKVEEMGIEELRKKQKACQGISANSPGLTCQIMATLPTELPCTPCRSKNGHGMSLCGHLTSLPTFGSKSGKNKDKATNFREGVGLEECKVSKEMLIEAKEMVKGENSYGVRIGGYSENEMILEWRGTPLVRVSTWRS